MSNFRWFFALLIMCCVGVSACGDDSTTTQPTADLGADSGADTGMAPDTDSDTGPNVDGVAPTVSITSGLRSNVAGNYRLEGIALDNRGLATLSYSIDDAPAVVIAATSPFSVDLSLPQVAVITVTATDAAGNQGAATVTVTRAAVEGLVADFTVSTETSTFSPVLFDASASVDAQGRSLSYAWNFGDASIGFDVTTAHFYPTEGTYTVKLTVSTPDGDSDEITRDVVIADYTPDAFATLSGVVVDPQGGPVQAVSVLDRAGTLLTTTDSQGQFSLSVGTDVPLVYVFKRDDYTTQVLRTRVETGDTAPRASIRMMPRARPVFLLDAAAGGVVEGDHGARIEFQANGLVDDQTGAAITGPVAITLTPIDHQTDERSAFPGLFEAYSPDGSVGTLTSFGVIEVTLSQNGRKVQLAPGKSAMLEIPYTAQNGQAGMSIPVWSLDEKTGYWLHENDSPIQQATSGSGLVQRTEVFHFSWINCDVYTPEPALSVEFQFQADGLSVSDEFEVDVDYTCKAPGVSGQRVAAKSGQESVLLHSNCDATMDARSESGRYFGRTSLNTGDSTTPMLLDVVDTTQMAVLSPSTPVQGTLAADGRAYFAVQATAANSFAVRVESLTAGFSGDATLLPPHRVPRPAQGFLALANTTLYGTGTGLWVIAVDAKNGAGDFEIELTSDPAATLQNSVTQTFVLPANAIRDFVVNATANDLARILVTGGQSISVNVLNDQGNNTLFSFNGASDTGLFEFKKGGARLVRLQNFGAEATVTMTYAVSAPPTVVTAGHVVIPGDLNAAQVAVYLLPHVGGSGVVAQVQNTAPTLAAPQVSLMTGNLSSFPFPSLGQAQLRNTEATEAVAALGIPTVANENTYWSYAYVSSPTHAPVDFNVEFNRVAKASALKVGTCQGAQTTSATAAAIALEDNGVLTFCPEDHKTFAGLKMAQPHFTLKGMDRDLSRLVPWSDASYAVSTGTYGINSILNTSEAAFEDLTILNRNLGIGLNYSDNIRIERVNIEALTPLTSINKNTSCVDLGGGFGTPNNLSVVDSRCTNAEQGLNLSNLGDVVVTGSEINTTVLGVFLSNGKSALIQDNMFSSSPRAISVQQLAGLATITGNDIAQANSTNNGSDSIQLTLRNLTAAAPAIQSKISDNTIALAGLNSSGIAFGYNANNGDLLIDGNNVTGDAAGQIGIRAYASFSNVVGGQVRVQNNVLGEMGKHAVHILQADTYAGLGLFNNSVRVPITGATSIFNLGTQNAAGTGAVEFYNNIVMGGGTANGLAYAPTLNLAYDNNLFFQVGTAYKPSTGLASLGLADIENLDPLFVNDDLEVAPTSPAVNAGAANGPATAYGGGLRPVGGAKDIGAYEQ